MNKKDIVEMYKKGYSVKYICNEYYKYRNKEVAKPHYFNGTFIISKKKASRKICDKTVYDTICSYNSIVNEI